MAKQKADREDILRDGRAMPVRGRAWIDGHEVVIGFRVGGQASLYWDQDPVYQWNAQQQLRRLYFEGGRFASFDGVICALDQTPSDHVDSVVLLPVAISPSRHQAVVDRWRKIRESLSNVLSDSENWEVIGVSVEEYVSQCRQWIADVGDDLVVASSPRVG